MRVLLAQEDGELAAWLTDALAQRSILAEWTNDGAVAERILDLEEFDAVILDLELPGKSGYGILSHLKASKNHAPVLILTARDTLSERVTCLNAGADDFLAKPFALAELQARLHAVIRRSRNAGYLSISCGALVFNVLQEQFRLAGAPLPLTPREHALLKALIQRAGTNVPKQALFDRIFRRDDSANLEAVEVLIHRLRKKLAATPVKISNARGFGYRLEQAGDGLSAA